MLAGTIVPLYRSLAYSLSNPIQIDLELWPL